MTEKEMTEKEKDLNTNSCNSKIPSVDSDYNEINNDNKKKMKEENNNNEVAVMPINVYFEKNESLNIDNGLNIEIRINGLNDNKKQIELELNNCNYQIDKYDSLIKEIKETLAMMKEYREYLVETQEAKIKEIEEKIKAKEKQKEEYELIIDSSLKRKIILDNDIEEIEMELEKLRKDLESERRTKEIYS